MNTPALSIPIEVRFALVDSNGQVVTSFQHTAEKLPESIMFELTASPDKSLFTSGQPAKFVYVLWKGAVYKCYLDGKGGYIREKANDDIAISLIDAYC